MTNLQTNHQTAKPSSQESFNNVMAQLNAAIVSWGRFYDGRGPAMTKAFIAARKMIVESFPAEAAAYDGAPKEAAEVISTEVEYPAGADVFSKVNYTLLTTNKIIKDSGRTINSYQQSKRQEYYRAMILAVAVLVIVILTISVKYS